MKIVRYVLLFILIVILQTTLCKFISVRGIEPDLIVLFILFVAIQYGALAGVWAGFFAGMIWDVYSPQTPLGSGIIANSIIGYLAGLMDERTLKLDEKYRLILIFVATLLHGLIFTSVAFSLRTAFHDALVSSILPSALYTTLIGGVLLIIASRKG